MSSIAKDYFFPHCLLVAIERQRQQAISLLTDPPSPSPVVRTPSVSPPCPSPAAALIGFHRSKCSSTFEGFRWFPLSHYSLKVVFKYNACLILFPRRFGLTKIRVCCLVVHFFSFDTCIESLTQKIAVESVLNQSAMKRLVVSLFQS